MGLTCGGLVSVPLECEIVTLEHVTVYFVKVPSLYQRMYGRDRLDVVFKKLASACLISKVHVPIFGFSFF